MYSLVGKYKCTVLKCEKRVIFYVNHIFIWRTPNDFARTPVWEYLTYNILSFTLCHRKRKGPKVLDHANVVKSDNRWIQAWSLKRLDNLGEHLMSSKSRRIYICTFSISLSLLLSLSLSLSLSPSSFSHSLFLSLSNQIKSSVFVTCAEYNRCSRPYSEMLPYRL